MTERLHTAPAEGALQRIKPALRHALQLIEQSRFADADPLFAAVKADITAIRETPESEALLCDLFAIKEYVEVIASYRDFWRCIWEADYPASWGRLQDALDHLRLVKRFSTIDVEYFEAQMIELESAYPYKVFASIGAIVDRFDCSICGLDIDGMECLHRRGELYAGQLAYGIARNITNLDHVSLVLNPDDKRCVVQLENTPEQFPILAYIRQQWLAGNFRVGWLTRLEWSKRTVSNPDYRTRGRNDPCYCGGRKKFKKCCMGKDTLVQDHVELVGEPRDIRLAIV